MKTNKPIGIMTVEREREREKEGQQFETRKHWKCIIK